jgi:hypothetical protein
VIGWAALSAGESEPGRAWDSGFEGCQEYGEKCAHEETTGSAVVAAVRGPAGAGSATKQEKIITDYLHN